MKKVERDLGKVTPDQLAATLTTLENLEKDYPLVDMVLSNPPSPMTPEEVARYHRLKDYMENMKPSTRGESHLEK